MLLAPVLLAPVPEAPVLEEILNLKAFYAILSQIWKCCKSRFFGANFWGGELVGANFYAFCNYAVKSTLTSALVTKLASDPLS